MSVSVLCNVLHTKIDMMMITFYSVFVSTDSAMELPADIPDPAAHHQNPALHHHLQPGQAQPPPLHGEQGGERGVLPLEHPHDPPGVLRGLRPSGLPAERALESTETEETGESWLETSSLVWLVLSVNIQLVMISSYPLHISRYCRQSAVSRILSAIQYQASLQWTLTVAQSPPPITATGCRYLYLSLNDCSQVHRDQEWA